MPETFALNVRVQLKHGCKWWLERRRIPQIDAIAVCIFPESQLQASDLPVCKRLDRMSSLANTACDRLWTSPECGRQTALAGERGNDLILSDVGQQSQGAIHARLTTSVSASDDIELSERQLKVA